jgi:outer membrane protein assembly factor BamB
MGRITAPSVQWQAFVGATQTLLELAPGVAAEATATEDKPDLSDPRWGLLPPLGEIAGKPQRWEPSSQVTYADILPDVPGLEKLEFESGFSKPTINGQWQDAVGWCDAWRNGAWERVWQSDTIHMLFSALPIVGDFDADGEPEIALLPWHELLILNARTGQVEDRCSFTPGRSYGHFSVWDMDQDGRSEFLVQSDFAKHVEVLGYRDGKLALLWQREIELDISNPQKILRVHPRPVADVDGDGRLEVLVNTYNDTGDRRWRLAVHDGMGGAVKVELPDTVLQGVADVNGDGAAELLTVHATARGLPTWSTIQVISLRGGKPRPLWQRPNAAWQTWDPVPPLNVNTGATLGRRDVMHRTDGGAVTTVIREPAAEGAARLSVCGWEQDRFRTVMACQGPGLEAVGLDAGGSLLVRSTAQREGAAGISLSRARTMAQTTRQVAGSAGVVAIGKDVRLPRPVVVVQGHGQELVVFQAPEGDAPAQRLLTLRGRGQATDWPAATPGPVLADLAGDGRRQVIYAATAPSGAARLVAQDVTGEEAWHADFPEIPGGLPYWNTGGLILWQVGHFTDPTRLDVALTLRRSMMHSEETAALSGANGRVLWRRDRQTSNRGVGGTSFAIADFDGDGLDDIASLHPSILYIMRGDTGVDLIARDTLWDEVPAKPVYWGMPIAVRVENRPALFFGTGSRSMTGLIRADGSLAWWDALDQSPSALPAFGDFDGDGSLDALGWGYPDGIRCYDVATGQVKWRMALPVPAGLSGMASGDVDGDGRDEVVGTAGRQVFCLQAEAGTGKVTWTVDLPCGLGAPTLADVDGDGQLSIVVAGTDGNVYCLR